MSENLPISNWLNTFPLRWQDFLIALAILAVFHLFRKSIEKICFRVIRRFTKKMSRENFEASVKAFENPIAGWISFIGFYIAFQYLAVQYPFLRLYVNDNPERLMKAITVICIALGFYNLGDLYGNLFVKLDDKLNLNTSNLFKNMVSQVIRVLIVILAVGMAASEFFDVNGFIAGLGIAGLAVAMAAQDTLGNMIAGAAIVVDRPYDLGDWILCEGIEGEVEELSFRSTRIRTVTQEIVYIPNSNMSKNPITNFTRRGYRRVDVQTVFEFDTPLEKIEALQKEMMAYLETQTFVRTEGLIVKMDQFSPYGLSFVVKCYVDTNIYNEYIQYKEQINFALLSTSRTLGIEMAKPPGGGSVR